MNNIKVHWVVIGKIAGKTTISIDEDQATAIRRAVQWEIEGMSVKLTTLKRFLRAVHGYA